MLDLKCKKCKIEWCDFDLELDESEDFQTDNSGNVLTVCEDCRHKRIDRETIGISALEYRIENSFFDQKTMELVERVINHLPRMERESIEDAFIHTSLIDDYIDRITNEYKLSWTFVHDMIAHLRPSNEYFLCINDSEEKFLSFYNMKESHIEDIALDTIDLYNRLESGKM